MAAMQENSTAVSLMAGTAGHVDHGKTSLVKHLTGINTDRHKEEQSRGMSIDFGVAPCKLDDGRLIGIIDVPGHEDFIRNMVAGASSMDVLMLVIAADDAVMPQTVEHLQIVRTLGVSRIMVVLTKIDLVEEEMLSMVKEEVGEFISKAGFPTAPVICVSNTSGEGLAEVRAQLNQLAQSGCRPEDKRSFRMYVRETFSVKGYGTITTGVPCSGQVAPGDNLELLPARKICGVRAIQVYRQESSVAQAGLSAAINLRDIQLDELSRGMVLSEPGIYQAVKSAVLWVKNHSTSKIIKRRTKLRFHAGTAAVVGDFVLLGGEELLPDAAGFFLVRFSEPVVIGAGDRFVLRILSPAETVGGGLVLSVSQAKTLRKAEESERRLTEAKKAVEEGDYFLSELLLCADPVVREQSLSFLSSANSVVARQLIKEKEAKGEVVALGENCWLLVRRAKEICQRFKKHLARYHRENKYAWGMKPAFVADMLHLPASAFAKLSSIFLEDQELCLRHGCLSLANFLPPISERELKFREAIIKKVSDAGAGSVAKGDLQKELGLSQVDLKMLSKLLVDEGIICSLGGNYMLTSIIEECRQKLRELFKAQQVVELAAFREKTGLSRNIAVTVLEHFDSEGMTRRQGAGRILLR